MGTRLAPGWPMTRGPASGRAAAVLARGHRLVLPLLVLAVLTVVLTTPPVPALAQGKGGDGKAGKGATAPKKSEEEVLLEAIGADWMAGSASAVAARLPEKAKVSLRLPGAAGGEYRREQAKSLLEEYFRRRTFAKVELKSVKEQVGTFAVEYTGGDRRKVAATLLLTLGTEEGKRVLVGARETP